METEFNLYTSSPSPVFSDNISDLVIERKPECSTSKRVRVIISINNISLCNEMVLYYDAKGLVTINLKEIIKGQNIKYSPLESDMSSQELPIDNIRIVLIDEQGATLVKAYDIILGGTDTYGSFTSWSRENWLTWQPQIVKMPLWQPQYLTMVKLNDSHDCNIYSRLYTRNGIELVKSITSFVGDSIATVDVCFKNIWASECIDQSLTALCYDVYGEWDDGAGVANPFIQRYTIRNESAYDRCFMYQNSLGGFDTVMATGTETVKADGDVRTFISADAEHELINSHSTTIEQDTGYIDNERKARQWKEFLASNNRAVYRNGQFVKIVVPEYDLKHKQGELTSYSFDYRLSTKDETTSYKRDQLPKFKQPHQYYNHGQ